MALSISNAAAKAAVDALTLLCDGGATTNASAHIKIYSGSVPTDADTALGAQTLLAELPMSNPAFAASTDLNPGARATAGAITDDTVADNTGTASFFRIVNRSGTTVILQGSVTATGGGGDLTLNTVSIQANALVSVTSLTVTQPES